MSTYLSFDALQPGQSVGSCTLTPDKSLYEQWRSIYPDEQLQNPLPVGLLTAIMMRAYTQICRNRPMGNIHAGQTIQYFNSPALETPIYTQINCLSKRLEKNRRWVTFGVEMSSTGRKIVSAEMVFLWAA